MTIEEQTFALVKLRSKLAFSANSKHSWSFSDAELVSILQAQPKTLDELGTLKGFPRQGKKVKAYGHLIVDIINGTAYNDFKVSGNDDEITVEAIKPLSSFR